MIMWLKKCYNTWNYNDKLFLLYYFLVMQYFSNLLVCHCIPVDNVHADRHPQFPFDLTLYRENLTVHLFFTFNIFLVQWKPHYFNQAATTSRTSSHHHSLCGCSSVLLLCIISLWKKFYCGKKVWGEDIKPLAKVKVTLPSTLSWRLMHLDQFDQGSHKYKHSTYPAIIQLPHTLTLWYS